MANERADHEAYAKRHGTGLPWGFWLIIDAISSPSAPLVDENGDRWVSLRDALWRGRLRMGHGQRLEYGSDEHLDFLLQMLAVYSREVQGPVERVIDLFEGNPMLMRFYEQWLIGLALLTVYPRSGETKLTDEGEAVLKMLIATRHLRQSETPTGKPASSGYREPLLEPDYAGIAKAIAAAEASLPRLDHRFVPHSVAGKAALILVSDSHGVIPQQQTTWAISFFTNHERDRMYLWCLARANRWQSWAELVRTEGARALTEHLLQLLMASVSINLPDD